MEAEVSTCTLKPVPYTTLPLGPLCFHQSFKTAAEPVGQLGGLREKGVLIFPPAGKPDLYLEGTGY